MVYIDSKGNVVEKKSSIFSFIFSFFSIFIGFFLSLFGFSQSSNSSGSSHRDQLRRDDGRWPGSGGPGGPGRPGRGDGFRRPIGRLPTSSGMSCPPMGG
ncbi:unnamed protein product [Auanema sp. JU1783]|nr:unnamed protein product [Auanema sp. JU1783]